MAKGIVLVVGATGSVGRHVVEQAIKGQWHVRALVRDRTRVGRIAEQAELIEGQLTSADSLEAAVEGIDAVIFTQGASYGDAVAAEAVDYGAVKNVLTALNGRPVRIALMTSIGVTKRGNTHDWKRRGERLVRASGNAYTIVRPGWFDYNKADQLKISPLQGDRRLAGSPADGVIARHQIARVLVESLSSPAADHVTLELVAERGTAQEDLEPIFATLDRDTAGSVDGVRDQSNMVLHDEPERVRADLAAVTAS